MAAFTLAEAVVALTLFGIASAGTLWSLNTINNQSVAARLFTNATFIAQNQIELAQTDGPFVPQKLQVPLSLGIDLQQKPNITVYTDPVNDNIIVTGTITTQVTDPGFILNTTNLNMRQIKITVTYTYRGKDYSVVMDTMRTSDL
jgi:type II secretory pathway pseudopilin PulG